MKKFNIDKIIDSLLFIYILSLYFFEEKPGLVIYCNIILLITISVIICKILVNKGKIIINKFLILQFIFILICLCSSLYSININTSVEKVRTLVLIFMLSLFLVNYIKSYEKIRLIIKYFIISGSMLSIYIILTSDFTELTRFGSNIGNVNSIGLNICTAAIFAFYMIIDGNKKYIIPLIPMFFTILITGSRKSLILLIFSISIILLLNNIDSIKNIIKYVFILFVILIISYNIIMKIPIFYDILGKRIENMMLFLNGSGTLEGSINTRFNMINLGWDLFAKRPILGYGIDSYRYFLFKDIGLETYSHNNFIEIMVGTGIVGLISYYATHIIVLYNLIININRRNDRKLGYVFIAFIISYLFIGYSLVYYDSKWFAILISLASIYIMTDKKINKI